MIYSHWYFCNCIKLSPTDTAEFLNILYTLENHLPVTDQLKALKRLEELDMLQRAYALPVLIDLLLSRRSREYLQEQENDAEVASLIRKSKKLIIGVFWQENDLIKQDDHVSVSYHCCPMPAAIHKLEILSVDQIPKLVSDSIKRNKIHQVSSVNSYLETDEFSSEILWLSLLRTAGRENPQLLTELDFGELLKEALAESCGELPFQLALEVQSFHTRHFRDLIRDFPKNWLARPFCVFLVLKQLFCKEKRFDEKNCTLADALLAESWQLAYFDKNYYRCRSDLQTMWIDDKMDERGIHQVCAVLWQVISWEIAFDLDPVTCTRFWGSWWGIPYFSKGRIKIDCSNTQKVLLSGAGITVIDEKQLFVSLCSPWQYCVNDAEAVQKEAIPFSDYPYFVHHFVALRAFSAAVLLHRIFCAMRNHEKLVNSITFYRLILNLGDAFESRSARKERETGTVSGIWSRALRGFGIFAWQRINDMVNGVEFPQIPQKLVQLLWNPRQTNNRELKKLIGKRGLFICAHWAEQSMLSDISSFGQEKNEWLSERGSALVSYAEQICEKLFTEHFEEACVSTDALELLCQKYHRLFCDGCLYLEDTWNQYYQEQKNEPIDNKQPIMISDLLLVPEIALKEWIKLSPLYQSDFCPDAWVLVQTLRLQAVVRVPKSEQKAETVEQWFQEWYSAVANLNPADMKNHLILYELCNLLRPVDLVQESQEPVSQGNQIFLAVIDTVYSVVSTETIFYVKLLSDFLSQKKPVFPFTESTLAQAQKATIVKLIGLEEEAFQKILYRFLAECADCLQQESVYSVRRLMSDHWRLRCATEYSMRMENICKTQWNPLTDRFLLHNGECLTVTRPTQDPAKNFWNDLAVNGFITSVDPTDRRQKMVGIVVKKKNKRDNKGIYCIYTVNCGSGGLLTAEASSQMKYSPKKYKEGQVVILRFAEKENTYIIQTTAWMPGASDETVRVKVKDLNCSADYIFIEFQLPNHQTVTISEKGGGDVNKDEQRMRLSRLLDLWYPDTVRFFREGNSVFSKQEFYEAVYDQDLEAYIPVERDFSRLLLERILIPENPLREISFVYIRKEQRSENTYYLLNWAPGINYLVSEKNWISGSMKQLSEMFPNDGLISGLQINARLVIEDGFPYLSLDQKRPCDDRNLKWAALFQEDEPFYLEYDSSTYERFVSRNFNGEELTFHGKVYSRRPEDSRKTPKISRSGCNVQITANGWDSMQQRKGTVLCELLDEYYISKKFFYPETVRQMINLETGVRVRLSRVLGRKPNKGYYRAVLDNGLPAFCAIESLSMLQTVEEELCTDRICIVENVYPSEKYIDTLEAGEYSAPENVKAIRIPEVEAGVKTLRGIVARYTLVSPDRTTDNVCHEVWFNNNDQLFKCNIPVSAFQEPPRKLGAIVIAHRMEEEVWSFEAVNRTIYVRALWKIDAGTRESSGTVQGKVLGRDVRVPGHDHCLVSQNFQKPVLHIWRNDINLQTEPFCGIENEEGAVSRVCNRFSSPYTFSYAKRTDIVCLDQNGLLIWGESERDEFGQASYTWSVDFVIEVPKAGNLEGYYDIRRVFRCEARVAGEKKADRQSEHMKNVVNTYEEWMKETIFPLHITGIVQGHELIMSGLEVPELYDHATIIDHWTVKVPFVEGGERTWADPNRENPYARKVRAVLRLINNVWHASCRDAEPFRVNTALVTELRAVSGELIHLSLYYAGPEDDGYLRFEWGNGYCFLARREDIVDSYGNSTGVEFFYGDRIKEFQFIQGKGEHGWRLCVPTDAIEHQIAWQLWQDGRQNILQLLKIYINRTAPSIEIKEVSMVEYSIENYNRSSAGWRFQSYRRCVLDHESVKTLLAENELQEEERIILANLDLSKDKNKLRGLTYNYISLNDIALHSEIIAGKTICLVAGEISPSRVSRHHGRNNRFTPPVNDYLLKFYFPDELLEKEDEQDISESRRFTVSVLRRAFSLDESKLRVLFQEKHVNEYYGRNMLVQLHDPIRGRDYEWTGSVSGTVPRSKASLSKWVEDKSGCLVILGKPDINKDSVCVEIAPGITCILECSSISGDIQEGSTALLYKDEGNMIRAEVILPGDTCYVPSNGRPVELLLMDGAVRRYYEWERGQGKNEIEDSKHVLEILSEEKKHLTVASFSQIMLYNPKALVRMISMPPPRLGYLKPGKYGNQNFYLDEAVPFYAAYLDIDENTDRPILRHIFPKSFEEPTEWSRISFMDDTPDKIRTFTEQGRWHYHDKETAVYDREQRKWERYGLPDGEHYNKIVFFPTTKDTLRLESSQLNQYGYSAREITEHGLPVKGGFYPVACANRDSLWIELMPGRIVELPRKYLFHSAGKQSLQNMYCQVFHPGDLICLNEGFSHSGGQRQILLSDFRFGVRSSFGEKRNFLPVLKVISGSGVCLGCENQNMIYPDQNANDWVGKRFSYVDRHNYLRPADGNEIFSYGDTVMLGLDKKGNLYIPGYAARPYVRIAYKNYWKNAEWLYRLLRDYQERKNFFDTISTFLTAKVIRYEAKGTERSVLTIAVEHSDLESLPVGSILCAVCLGMLEGENGNVVLLKAGDTIFRMKPEALLSGVPQKYFLDVVQCLEEKGQGLWLHKKEDGWHSGLEHNDANGTKEISLLLCVENARGILCCTSKELELCWLPLEKCSRAASAPVSAIWETLSHRKRRNAQVMPDGTLSLIDTGESLQKYSALRPAPAKNRAIPRILLKTFENGTYRYLAELYPMGDVVFLDSEKCLLENEEKGEVEPIPVELTKKYESTVTVVPLGTLRVRQRFPRWINNALGRSWSESGINISLFRQKVPDIYGNYAKRRNQGIADAARDFIDQKFLRSETIVNIKLCYLCALLQKKVQLSEENIELAMEFSKHLLLQWLEVQGIFIASGFDPERLPESKNKWHVDLLPALSGILLLSDLSCPQNGNLENISRGLAVHLTRMLGLACDSSIHIEVLLNKWMMVPEQSGFWRRLSTLSLGGVEFSGELNERYSGYLSTEQKSILIKVCMDIKDLSFTEGNDDLKLVADCLLYSIGELNDFQLFSKKFDMQNKDYVMNQLSVLGHILTPSANGIPAMARLTKEMEKMLSIICSNLDRWHPLAVLTDKPLPLGDGERSTILQYCQKYEQEVKNGK